jgi:hypothetical protein
MIGLASGRMSLQSKNPLLGDFGAALLPLLVLGDFGAALLPLLLLPGICQFNGMWIGPMDWLISAKADAAALNKVVWPQACGKGLT